MCCFQVHAPENLPGSSLLCNFAYFPYEQAQAYNWGIKRPQEEMPFHTEGSPRPAQLLLLSSWLQMHVWTQAKPKRQLESPAQIVYSKNYKLNK